MLSSRSPGCSEIQFDGRSIGRIPATRYPLSRSTSAARSWVTPLSPGRHTPKKRTPALVLTTNARLAFLARGKANRNASVIGGKLKPWVGDASPTSSSGSM